MRSHNPPRPIPAANLVLVEDGPDGVRHHEISESATIGRRDCDLTLRDLEASRLHARIRIGSAGAEIEDLGSTNGTRVNGQPVESATVLRPGDRVGIGTTDLHVERPRDITHDS